MHAKPRQLLEDLQAGFIAGDEFANLKVVERKNIDSVSRLYSALEERAFERAVEVMTEDIDYEILGQGTSMMVQKCIGRDAVMETLVRNFGYVTEQNPKIISVVAQGDSVVVVGAETGRFIETGKLYKGDWVHIFTFRNQLVSRFRQIADVVID